MDGWMDGGREAGREGSMRLDRIRGKEGGIDGWWVVGE
jgi:hypothetical protein